MAENILEEGQRAMALSSSDKADIMARMEDAPDDTKQHMENLLTHLGDDTAAEEDWFQINNALIKTMPITEHEFSAMEDGKTSVGLFNQGYEKDKQHMAVLALPLLNDSVRDIEVSTMPEFSGTKAVDELTKIETGQVSVFVDIPMSIVWGNMTYREARKLLKLLAEKYNEENSLEKALERQLAPRSQETINRLVSEVQGHEAHIQELHLQIQSDARNIFEKEQQKQMLEQGDNVSEVIRKIKRLVDGGGYRDIRIDGQALVFTVPNVKVEWDGYTYPYGDFTVSLDLNSGGFRATASNQLPLTQRQLATLGPVTLHPHVRDNTPCLGNYQNVISQEVLAQKLDVAMVMVRRFLTSYHPDAPYKPIETWLPDHLFARKDETPRPWLVEDDPANPPGPGDNPTPEMYGQCFEQSKTAIEHTHAKIRCLDKPFGSTCEACPHYTNRDALYPACASKVGSEESICMRCQDFNCPHLEDAEKECVDTQVETNAAILPCVECPFGRQESCTQAKDKALENCWSRLQESKDESDRACGTCTHTECEHNYEHVPF